MRPLRAELQPDWRDSNRSRVARYEATVILELHVLGKRISICLRVTQEGGQESAVPSVCLVPAHPAVRAFCHHRSDASSSRWVIIFRPSLQTPNKSSKQVHISQIPCAGSGDRWGHSISVCLRPYELEATSASYSLSCASCFSQVFLHQVFYKFSDLIAPRETNFSM